MLEQIVRASMEPRERVGAASDHCALRAIGQSFLAHRQSAYSAR
jgi:hypothetical protein